MKVFLGWSGETSRGVARILHGWLPSVIQALRPHISFIDIDKGANWRSMIARELTESTVGIICLTQDNLTAPWIHFEAGVLASSPEKSVIPFLVGVAPLEVPDPLGQFQLTVCEEGDVFRLLCSLNARLTENERLTNEGLRTCFEVWWPQLTSRLEVLGEESPATEPAMTRTEQRLEELVESMRQNTEGMHQNNEILLALVKLLPQRPLPTAMQSTLEANLRDARLSTESFRAMIDGLSVLQASTHWAKDVYREYLADLISNTSHNTVALSQLTMEMHPSVGSVGIKLVPSARRTDEILRKLMSKMEPGSRYSGVSDVQSWLGAQLERFFDESCVAAERGVLIRRIFVVRNEKILIKPSEPDEAFRELSRHFKAQSSNSDSGYHIRLYNTSDPNVHRLRGSAVALLAQHVGIFEPAVSGHCIQVEFEDRDLSVLRLANLPRNSAIQNDFDRLWQALDADLTF
jgi:hypothetical protein